MDKILNEFETSPDRDINFRVTPLRLLKKSLIDFVISVTCSVLIRSDLPKTCRQSGHG